MAGLLTAKLCCPVAVWAPVECQSLQIADADDIDSTREEEDLRLRAVEVTVLSVVAE